MPSSLLKFGNHLLDGLPAALAEPGRKIDYAYFPIDCVVSLGAMVSDGATIEVAMVGCGGMLPVCAVLSDGVPVQKAIVQIAGTAQTIKPVDLRRQMRAYPALERTLLRYAQAMLNLAGQTAACASLHRLEQRCVRWLLMAHDRIRSDEIRVTHEALATMLGVRRAGVTVAAQALQARGLIEYRHGTVFVRDRKRLEAAACECYGYVIADFARLVGVGA